MRSQRVFQSPDAGLRRHVESLRECSQPHGARKACWTDHGMTIVPGTDAQQLSSLIGRADKAEPLTNHPLNETARRRDRTLLWCVPVGGLPSHGGTVFLAHVISHTDYL